MEDGNNFGVEIQEETVKMIKEIESDLGSLWRDTFYSDYCKDRARYNAYLCLHSLFCQVEDGNNFGVGVQKDILDQVNKLESKARSLWKDPGFGTSTRFLTSGFAKRRAG